MIAINSSYDVVTMKGERMSEIRIEIDCPNLKCKINNCECFINYEAGTERVFCPICGYSRKYFHKRDNNGNYDWNNKSGQFSFDNIVIKRKLTNDPYETYIIEGASVENGIIVGELYNQYDYNNFLNYLDYLLYWKHDLTKVSVKRFLEGRPVNIILFPKHNF